MLISQMFHIDGNPPDGVLLWWIGSLFAGVLLRSNPALAFAMLLVRSVVRHGKRSNGRRALAVPAGWAAITASFIWQRWRPGVHISGIAISAFVISLGYLMDSGIGAGMRFGHRHDLVAGLGVIAAAAAVWAVKFRPDVDTIAAPALGYAIAVAFAGLFAMQFIDAVGNRELILLAALTLAGLLAAIWYGLMIPHRGALWLGYIGFSIEILSLYWKTVGSILETSLFFLMAGVIVAGLAFMAWRLMTRNDAQRAGA